MLHALFLVVAFPVTGVVALPPGVTEVHAPITIPDGAHDLKITGNNTVLHVAGDFKGRAVLSCNKCRNVEFRGFTIDGNRAALEKSMPMPPSNVTFAAFYPNNGILIENSHGITISQVHFRNVANFALLVSASQFVTVSHAAIDDSGSLNAKGRNNTSGGILFEEGSSEFTVEDSTFDNIRGNAVWTHSRYGSPRNGKGEIRRNSFAEIGRDAIQVGHAHNVSVAGNKGRRIGFPAAIVDIENLGIPVAIDTAGDVDYSSYVFNSFEDMDGQCIDLDGFHDGLVRGNACTNRARPEDYPYGHYGIALNNANPDMQSRNIQIVENRMEGMKFGGIFLLGTGHQVLRNRLININTAHCNDTQAKFGCVWKADEPDMLRSGIYLSTGGARRDPARHITIEGNVVTGWGMDKHCIVAAPGVKLADNKVRDNACSNR